VRPERVGQARTRRSRGLISRLRFLQTEVLLWRYEAIRWSLFLLLIALQSGEHALTILAWKATPTDAVAVLTSRQRALFVDPHTGGTNVIAEGLKSEDTATLLVASTTCKNAIVYDGRQTSSGQVLRTDIFVRPVGQLEGRKLTGQWPGTVHADPRFSSDCQRIVFVSDEP
jgi:hypothetical protein